MNKLILNLITPAAFIFSCLGMHPPALMRSLSRDLPRGRTSNHNLPTPGREPITQQADMQVDEKKLAAHRAREEAETAPDKQVKPEILADELFACTGFDKEIERLVKEYTYDPMEVFPAIVTKRSINSTSNQFKILPNGNIAVMDGNMDGYIKIFDAKTCACIQTIKQTGIWLHQSMHCMPNGHILTNSLSFYPDGSELYVWDCKTGNCIYSSTSTHRALFKIIKITQDNRVVIGFHDGTVQLWDPATDQIVTFTGHTTSITSMLALPNGTIATAAEDCTLRLWTQDTGKCIQTKKLLHNVLDMHELSSGQIILEDDSHHIYVWDTTTNEMRKVYKNTDHAKAIIKVTPYAVVMITGLSTLLWDKACTTLLENCMGYTPEIGFGGHIITASTHEKITIFGKSSLQPLVILKGSTVAASDATLATQTNPARGICVYRIDPKAVAELNTLSFEKFEKLKKFIDKLQKISKTKRLPTMLIGGMARELMALPKTIRSCLATYYQVTTEELEKEYHEICANVLTCTIL